MRASFDTRKSSSGRGIRRSVVILAALGLLAGACAGETPATAPAPVPAPAPGGGPAEPAEDLGEPFENGNNVIIIVPTAAGGGFDTEARLLQPYLQDALRAVTQTNVSVRVENHPGGENRIGATMVYNSAARDNMVWYYFTNILTAAELRDGSAATYRSAEFIPLAAWGDGPSAFVVRKSLELPARTLEGMAQLSQQRPILLGDVGLTAETVVMAGVMADNGIPINFDFVATNGTSDAVALLLRGDIDAVYTTGGGIRRFVEENPNELEFIVSTACSPDPTTPGIPTVVEAGVPGADLICASQTVPRVFLGAPSMSIAKSRALSQALLEVLEDPAFQQAAIDAGRFVAPGGPEVAAEAVSSKLGLLERYRAVLEAAGLL